MILRDRDRTSLNTRPRSFSQTGRRLAVAPSRWSFVATRGVVATAKRERLSREQTYSVVKERVSLAPSPDGRGDQRGVAAKRRDRSYRRRWRKSAKILHFRAIFEDFCKPRAGHGLALRGSVFVGFA